MIRPSSGAGRIWFYIVTLAVLLIALGAARGMLH
ncbi:UNVERIFIED_ORG: hypothetical protein M2312_005035 [Rhizobium esperanzae]|nr:hypothetical protein [Rhizobium esperanzae]